jgi:hypothetical protein
VVTRNCCSPDSPISHRSKRGLQRGDPGRRASHAAWSSRHWSWRAPAVEPLRCALQRILDVVNDAAGESAFACGRRETSIRSDLHGFRATPEWLPLFRRIAEGHSRGITGQGGTTRYTGRAA